MIIENLKDESELGDVALITLMFYLGANVLSWLEITVAWGVGCVYYNVQGDLGYRIDKYF